MHNFSSNKTFFFKKIWWNGKIAVPLRRILTNAARRQAASQHKNRFFCIRFALSLHLRSVRLSVRTRDFHSLKRSSTLLRTTNIKSAICTAKVLPGNWDKVTEALQKRVAQGSRMTIDRRKTHKL